MPKNAGRVALVLKGDYYYSNDTSYTKLDLVSYNGKSYVCKQPATGILPTNTAYWQLIETLAGAAGKIATDYNELGIPNGRLADICYILNNENKVEGHAGFVAELPKKE
jgi:hypothetical protein